MLKIPLFSLFNIRKIIQPAHDANVSPFSLVVKVRHFRVRCTQGLQVVLGLGRENENIYHLEVLDS